MCEEGRGEKVVVIANNQVRWRQLLGFAKERSTDHLVAPLQTFHSIVVVIIFNAM